MKFYGQAEDIAQKLIAAFKAGHVAAALSNLFIQNSETRHFTKWSWSNQFLVILQGYNDAMGFRQWGEHNRKVKKGEKAFYILAPMSRKGKATNPTTGKDEEYQYILGFRGVPVFGDTQTEGDEPLVYEADKFVESLPFIELAKHWGIKVNTYAGQQGGAAGVYCPEVNTINLGVKNVSTWFHELMHKADHDLGALNIVKYGKDKKEKVDAEVVAEFGGCVIAHMLGMDDAADDGGCWEYVSNYAAKINKDPAEICYNLINRTCNAIAYIMEESEKAVSPEPAMA